MAAGANGPVEPAGLREFIDGHVSLVQPRMREALLAEWEAATTGTEEANEKASALRAELMRVYADVASYDRLKAWYHGPLPSDPLLARQLTLLYLTYAEGQIDEESIESITALEKEAESTFTNYRGIYQGRPVSDNEIIAVLGRETDSRLLQEAWEASKQVGQQVESTVLELVRLRNAAAQRAGYQSHYQRSLALAEVDEERLFQLLDELKRLSDEPFLRAKAELDESLSRRYGIPAAALCPWHYSDPFFQRPPNTDGGALDGVFQERDVVDLAVRTFDGMDMDVRGVLARSDLYARNGKNQHAFCVDIDRSGDVRVLCNLEPNHRWMETLLHELGHAVYDVYTEETLPYLLRQPAHMLSTEGVAMLMGRLTMDQNWLTEVVGVSTQQIDELLPTLRAQRRLSTLIFIRWALVMIHFERELYRNPEQDLDALWWNLVEEYQSLKRPEGRRRPDWAAKIHLALYPVYYHNYLLGELMASQLQQFFEESFGGIVGNREAGSFLISEIFRHGARWHWDETLERSTGQRLSAVSLAGEIGVESQWTAPEKAASSGGGLAALRRKRS